jgi:hypothetical protein
MYIKEKLSRYAMQAPKGRGSIAGHRGYRKYPLPLQEIESRSSSQHYNDRATLAPCVHV